MCAMPVPIRDETMRSRMKKFPLFFRQDERDFSSGRARLLTSPDPERLRLRAIEVPMLALGTIGLARTLALPFGNRGSARMRPARGAPALSACPESFLLVSLWKMRFGVCVICAVLVVSGWVRSFGAGAGGGGGAGAD